VLDTITHIITYHPPKGMNTFIKDKCTPAPSNEHLDRQKDMIIACFDHSASTIQQAPFSNQ